MTHQFLFSPAQVGRASEDVALQIEAAIISKKVLPGDRLPSERALQEQFGTGRGVVREALRALKQKGLIEVRKGARGGAYAKEVELTHASESLALFLTQQHIHADHICELRESIDRTITLLAISRGTSEEKRELLEGAQNLAHLAESGDAAGVSLIEWDRQLNIMLAKMTKNPVFVWLMQAMQLGLNANDHALYERAEFRHQTIQNWIDTAWFIDVNEPLKALSCISNHFVILKKCLESEDQDHDMEKPFAS